MNKIIKTFFFMMIGPGSVIVYLPFLLMYFLGPPNFYKTGQLQYVGLIPVLAGICISLWCFYHFIFFGKGTPVPIDPPKKLVIIGLYRFVRNPMYIGILIILIGEAVLFRSYLLSGYTAGVFCLFHMFIIGYEEPSLKSRFGKEYEDYCSSVPRWIFRLRK